MIGDALISPGGGYRYWLMRQWDYTKPTCVFLMLNPSTADAKMDDMTVKKCIGFASIFGCGRFYIVNLFALRARSPAELWKSPDPIGPDNDRWIKEICDRHPKLIIAGWGAHGRKTDRYIRVSQILAAHKLFAIRQLADGHPEHPLMLPYNAKLVQIPVNPLLKENRNATIRKA